MKKDNHLIENIEKKGDLRGESETQMVPRLVDKILQKTKKMLWVFAFNPF